MARYALVNIESGMVENAIIWDGDKDKWSPPAGFDAIESEYAGPGWTYKDGQFVAPPASPEQDQAE